VAIETHPEFQYVTVWTTCDVEWCAAITRVSIQDRDYSLIALEVASFWLAPNLHVAVG
jgi:hypothetical protein